MKKEGLFSIVVNFSIFSFLLLHWLLIWYVYHCQIKLLKGYVFLVFLMHKKSYHLSREVFNNIRWWWSQRWKQWAWPPHGSSVSTRTGAYLAGLGTSENSGARCGALWNIYIILFEILKFYNFWEIFQAGARCGAWCCVFKISVLGAEQLKTRCSVRCQSRKSKQWTPPVRQKKFFSHVEISYTEIKTERFKPKTEDFRCTPSTGYLGVWEWYKCYQLINHSFESFWKKSYLLVNFN